MQKAQIPGEYSMKIGSYQFITRFTTSAILPEYKGSTLRGAFGRALKKCACALHRQECPSCMLAPSCCHSFIFEGQNLTGAQGRQHPYAIETDDDPRREYLPGDTLSFSFLLFGRANDYLPHVIYATQEMGKEGLGKNTREQGRYVLEKVGDKSSLCPHQRSRWRSSSIRNSPPSASPTNRRKRAATGPLPLICSSTGYPRPMSYVKCSAAFSSPPKRAAARSLACSSSGRGPLNVMPWSRDCCSTIS